MLSMTGFGTGKATAGVQTVTVDLRSVNHRFLDIAMKLPASVSPFEIDIRNVLKDRLARGRVSCMVLVDRESTTAAPQLLSRVIAQLQEMGAAMVEAGLPRPEITLDHVLAASDIFHPGDEDVDPEDLRGALLAALDEAVTALVTMKRIEGEGLAAELGARLKTVRGHLDTVKTLTPQAVEESLARLRERLAQLLDDQIDPQRLAQEAAILADRGNITEECERLDSHLEQFRAALAEGGQVAKRLNFLLQEMHREVNTMGSKTANMEITGAVIAMKEEVESMREQVQNLE